MVVWTGEAETAVVMATQAAMMRLSVNPTRNVTKKKTHKNGVSADASSGYALVIARTATCRWQNDRARSRRAIA